MKELEFEFAEPGPKQALVALDIALMGAQASNSFIDHGTPRKNISIEISRCSSAAVLKAFDAKREVPVENGDELSGAQGA